MSAELTIDLEFSGLIPAPHEDEVARLRQSLLDEGCRDPIVVWANHDDTILDGHTRYGICRAEDIPYKVKPLKFDSREAAKNWIVLNQLSRRNITEATRTYLLGLLYNASKDDHGGDRKDGSSSQSGNLKTAHEIAAKNAVGKNTVIRAGQFAEAVDSVAKVSGDAAKNAILETNAKQSDVKQLAAKPPAAQKETAKKLTSGKAKTLREALGKAKKEPKKKGPFDKLLKSLETAAAEGKHIETSSGGPSNRSRATLAKIDSAYQESKEWKKALR